MTDLKHLSPDDGMYVDRLVCPNDCVSIETTCCDPAEYPHIVCGECGDELDPEVQHPR